MIASLSSAHSFFIPNEDLESYAQQAAKLTSQYFGQAKLLYTPMYLSNYCVNQCVYCGFNTSNKIKRSKLSLEEIKKEAEYIAKTGLKHVLILTGESRKHTPLAYLLEAVKLLKNYFSSISVEIYPLIQDEYAELIKAGVDGLTIYQEVYEQSVYNKVHPAGPKNDYQFRYDAPERAAKAGIRTINIGALLGLADWKNEVYQTALHAEYLHNKYPEVELSISVPRLRPHSAAFLPETLVSDKELLQAIIAFRLYLPRVGLTLSTRESSKLRDALLPWVTKVSADSNTSVGGHTSAYKDSQFEIADTRDVPQMKQMLLAKGYQPVLKDWMSL